MKVWKSPVFYFGILLVLAVAGLLAAPFVVDWNGYRADLEAYGKKLTGRSVKIEGPITARLFPWPRLTADTVSIANPPGLETPEFARADRIVVRLTLAGLVRGGIDVQGLEVDNPTVSFERLATGEGNWVFTPAADLIRSDLLSRVSLDKITLNGGTLNFSDRRRGETFTLDDFNAAIAAPSVSGPWRMRSAGLYNDKAFDISLNTAAWIKDAPFRFGFRVAPADGSGLVFTFDGAKNLTDVEGQLRVEPQSTDTGKSDAEGKLRPLVFTSKVKATFDMIDLPSIEIAPSDPKEGGAITTGSATLTLGQHINAHADLSASMLDLDELAGAHSRGLLRKAGSLALADSLLKILPADVSLAASAKVTALKTGGETLDNVSLAIEADRNALRIGKFTTGLPGRSNMLFKGVYFPGEQGAELAGDLALESSDLRALSIWLWPEVKEQLAAAWTGSRGRFKLQTGVSVTAARVNLSKAQFELDGQQGKAELSVTSAGRGAVDVRIDGNRVDVDSFIPQGIPALANSAKAGIGNVVALALPREDAPDLRLTLQAAELLLNGVTARDVALDLASGANGLDLRALEIGSVGGARLEATGLILDNGKGADGSIGLDVKAEDPSELLRLLGLVRGDVEPAWARGLGQTAVKGNLSVKPSDEGPDVSFEIDGTAADVTLKSSGSLNAAQNIGVDLTFATPSSARLVSMLGFEPLTSDTVPGQIEVKAAGTMLEGFMVNAALRAYDARFDYQGTVNPALAGFGLDGKLSARSTEVKTIAGASGLPLKVLPEGTLVLDSNIKSDGGVWKFPDISGRLGENRISGTAELDTSGRLNGHIETGNLALTNVLSAVFVNWAGGVPDLETAFASRLPFGLTGELWIKPASLEVHKHFTAQDSEIGITATGDEIRLALFGKDKDGRDAQIEIGSHGTASSRKIDGRISIPVDLRNQLALVNGSPVASGLGMIEVKFDADGRSPGGALSALRGSGSYQFDDLRLLGLTPSAFNRTLAEAKDATGITAAFDALRSGEGLSFGKVQGTITIANGEVGFLPFSLKSDDADVQVKAVAELALGEIDADISLSLKARPLLPAMNISYAGSPSALSRNEENSELATKLGVTIMQQGIDELERLQREQKRLAEEEEKQRIVDEARLAAYYAQRDELLLRKRELKVHAEMRVVEAERLRQQLEAERAANLEINKSEAKQRAREIRFYRRMARLSPVMAPQRSPEAKPPPFKISIPKRAVSQADPVPVEVGPVIIDKPNGAPVVITPSPGGSPSQ